MAPISVKGSMLQIKLSIPQDIIEARVLLPLLLSLLMSVMTYNTMHSRLLHATLIEERAHHMVMALLVTQM